jgi:outer membrane protein assembly factor BamB
MRKAMLVAAFVSAVLTVSAAAVGVRTAPTRPAVMVAAALTASTGGPAVTDGAVTTSTGSVVVGPDCPDVMVIAARGTGEAPANWSNPANYNKNDDYGAGGTLYDLYANKLAPLRPDLHFSLEPVIYPVPNIKDLRTLANFESDASAGGNAIVTDIQQTDAACGHTVRYILAGYSLGAWAVHDALSDLSGSTAQLAEIAGAALFGDPKFQPGQTIVRDFKAQDTNDGMAVGVDKRANGVPASVVPQTGSWCFPDDPVCQVLPDKTTWLQELQWCISGPASLCAHFQYANQETRAAATFLAPFLPKTTLFPQLTLSTPPRGAVGTPYSWTATASCASPCHWSAPASQLPLGLNLSTAGVLSGTPTRTGTFTFAITATCKYGRSVPGQAAITIGAPGWVEAGANAGHTGLSTTTPALSAATVGQLHKLWSATLTTNTSVFASSPIAAGGIAYVVVPAASGSATGHLKAFSATTGALLWSQPINAPSECPYAGQESMTCEPAVAGNAVLTVGSYVTPQNTVQWTVQAFNAQTGTPLWTLKPQYDAVLTLATDGNTVYLAGDYQIEAVSATSGKVLWTVASPGFPYEGAPAIGGGYLYLITDTFNGSSDSFALKILNSTTGAAVASAPLPTAISDAPLVVDNGRVFLTVEPAGTTPAQLIAFDGATGATLWSSSLKWVSQLAGRPISTGGLVIVGDLAGTAAAINPATGKQVWLERSPNPPYLDPTLDAVSGDVMVTGGSTTTVGLIDVTNGTLAGTLSDPSSVLSATAPVIDAGTIYITSGGHLFAYGAN